jgi:hypothetical protein
MNASRSRASHLDLAGTGLTAIPDSLTRLTNPQLLQLFGNPLPHKLLAAADRGPKPSSVTEPKFLLVATRTKLTPPDLNLTEIQNLYPGCQGQFPVEFETLAGFASLEEKILELVAASPAMNAPRPAHWLPVRNEIRKIREARPHITPAEFHQLMESKSVREEQDQKDLAEQLHWLGEILYFQERGVCPAS